MVLSSDFISGAYILDNYGHFYRSYNEKPEDIDASAYRRRIGTTLF